MLILQDIQRAEGRADEERPLQLNDENSKRRGFSVSYVLFDSWYSSLENLKTIR
jgi:hypothetical protein